MRSALAALLLTTAAIPVAAGDGFGLGLEEDWLPLESVQTDHPLPVTADRMSLEVSDASHEALVYSSSTEPRSEREFRLALWNSGMGRLMHDRAAGDAMHGRGGLVGGGRMQGIGIAPTAALGDGATSPLQRLFDGGSWAELTVGEQIRSGIQVAIIGALLHYMAENAD